MAQVKHSIILIFLLKALVLSFDAGQISVYLGVIIDFGWVVLLGSLGVTSLGI